MLTSTRSAIVRTSTLNLGYHSRGSTLPSRKCFSGSPVYKTVWNPVLSKVHRLALEEGNEHDRFAVCVKRDEIIGHVPRALTFAEDFADNSEFNKRCSRLVATLE